MVEMVKCPYCGSDGKHKLLKVWRYKWWYSHLYECTNCGGRFRYHVDPSGQRKSFIIRLTRRKAM
ncbi:MAG: hypothetical protein QW182_03085 [Thermosphaera sp.]